MAVVDEGCKRSLEISIPVSEVEVEMGRVVSSVQKRAKLPGFRPGKVPANLLRKQFQSDIRQQVLENLIPKYLQKRFEEEGFRVVGTPDILDVHFEDGAPLHFKAEFEVAPEIELGQYTDLTVPYRDPDVTGEDIDRRLEQLRDQKAQYVNIDPRALEQGDFAVLTLESVGGVEGEPVRQNELTLEIGGADTLEAFSSNLVGMSPGEEKTFDVEYPEDYGQGKLAGRKVRFHAEVKGIRKKELPELNDEFAKDVGDFLNLEELREALRKSIFAERQYEAQQEAKNKLVDILVDQHDFPVPEALIDRQIQSRVERALVAEGRDPKSVRVDWPKVKSTQRDRALREVKASLLLTRISERESIDALRDEVDREVERIARQQREPVAAVRLRFEKDGTLHRIASHIQTEKTLSFLFEHARKEAET